MTREFLPHHNVVTRLGVSTIHGVGVFAGQDIAAGTVVFVNDCRPIRWVSESEVEASGPTPFERAFYRDFAIRRDGQLGTPETFELLTASWYVNEPRAGSEPNLRSAPDLTFIAARDIKQGEELTITYNQFSETS